MFFRGNILCSLVSSIGSLSYDFRGTFPGRVVAQKLTHLSLSAESYLVLMKPAKWQWHNLVQLQKIIS